MNITNYILNNNLKNIFEIGVGNPNICRTLELIDRQNIKLNLFEANPSTYNSLKKYLGNRNNVSLYNLAIFDRDGEILFCEDGDSSYVDEVISPTKHNVPRIAATKKKINVPCKNIKNFDNGDIDVILIDTEGSEWIIIKEMVSRPKLIVIETNNPDDHGNGPYETPNLDLIKQWMKSNNYKLIHKDLTDSYYEKSTL